GSTIPSSASLFSTVPAMISSSPWTPAPRARSVLADRASRRKPSGLAVAAAIAEPYVLPTRGAQLRRRDVMALIGYPSPARFGTAVLALLALAATARAEDAAGKGTAADAVEFAGHRAIYDLRLAGTKGNRAL